MIFVSTQGSNQCTATVGAPTTGTQPVCKHKDHPRGKVQAAATVPGREAEAETAEVGAMDHRGDAPTFWRRAQGYVKDVAARTATATASLTRAHICAITAACLTTAPTQWHTIVRSAPRATAAGRTHINHTRHETCRGHHGNTHAVQTQAASACRSITGTVSSVAYGVEKALAARQRTMQRHSWITTELSNWQGQFIRKGKRGQCATRRYAHAHRVSTVLRRRRAA